MGNKSENSAKVFAPGDVCRTFGVELGVSKSLTPELTLESVPSFSTVRMIEKSAVKASVISHLAARRKLTWS